MKTCIICRNKKEENQFNEEHMIPDSLGGVLKLYDICKECNSKLGNKIDVYLTNNLLSAMDRFILGIRGKSGEIPNPFKQGIGMNNAGGRIILDDNLRPKLIGKVIQGKGPNEYLVTASSEKEAYELIKKKFKRIYKKEVTDEEIKNMIIKYNHNRYKPEVQISEKIDFKKIELAIIKIAYEFTYYWLGNNYLEDIQSKIISEILFATIEGVDYKKPHNLIFSKQRIEMEDLRSEQLIKAISKGFNKESSEVSLNSIHLVQLFIIGSKMYCYVSIFGEFNYYVLVSQKPYEYSMKDKKLTFIELANTREYKFGDFSCVIFDNK